MSWEMLGMTFQTRIKWIDRGFWALLNYDLLIGSGGWFGGVDVWKQMVPQHSPSVSLILHQEVEEPRPWKPAGICAATALALIGFQQSASGLSEGWHKHVQDVQAISGPLGKKSKDIQHEEQSVHFDYCSHWSDVFWIFLATKSSESS